MQIPLCLELLRLFDSRTEKYPPDVRHRRCTAAQAEHGLSTRWPADCTRWPADCTRSPADCTRWPGTAHDSALELWQCLLMAGLFSAAHAQHQLSARWPAGYTRQQALRWMAPQIACASLDSTCSGSVLRASPSQGGSWRARAGAGWPRGLHTPARESLNYSSCGLTGLRAYHWTGNALMELLIPYSDDG